jgi:aspartyl protease family protein
MKRFLTPALAVLLTLPSLALRAEDPSLAEQLRQLAQQHHFVLKGDEHTEDFPASDASGPLPQRLKRMLWGFNFILINPPDRKIERLIILGRKGAPPPPPVSQTEFEDSGAKAVVLETGGSARQSTVEATLIGPHGASEQTRLIVDTGATSVVLPESMIQRLGINSRTLRSQQIHTANGVTNGQVGQLHAMRLGDEVIRNIEVAFINDASIGNKALLGMSVLSRYKIVLDDSAKTLTLLPKGDGGGSQDNPSQ